MIIGAGAVGSVAAYWLGAAGHHVTALARAPYVHAVRQRGLLVEREGRALRAQNLDVAHVVAPLEGAHFDLVVITTKVFDTAVAAVQARPFVQRGAQVLIVQNGIGGTEIATSILGTDQIYVGALTMPVEVLKPAVIRPHWAHGGLGIAAVDPDGDAGGLIGLFAAGPVPVRPYADWQAMKWSKLMVDLLTNAIPAILDSPVDRIYGDFKLYHLERAALREACTVALQINRKLVPLPGYRVPLLVWAMCSLPPRLAYPIFRRVAAESRGTSPSPLHRDLACGRKSEVEYLNGAVVRAGRRLGVPVPVNDMICQTLIGIANSEIEWSQYHDQAQRLIHHAQTATSM